jgi:inosine-uridine nucleoside N-ribohydrolase
MSDAPSRVRLWVDTDIGDDPDDAVALAIAARHPNVEIVGVSTVDRDIEWRAREARAVLLEYKCDANVVAGPPSHRALADSRADALLAIGPLTNIAHLIANGVALPPRVVIMGGALGIVHHRGIDMRVEYNFSRDASAAHAVVRGCERCTLVPLDVTARLCLTDLQEAKIRATAASLDEAIGRWRRERGVPVCLHDPLALLVLLGEAPVDVEHRRISVDGDGAIVIDGEPAVDREVVVDVDAPTAIERMIELVMAGDRSTQ